VHDLLSRDLLREDSARLDCTVYNDDLHGARAWDVPPRNGDNFVRKPHHGPVLDMTSIAFQKSIARVDKGAK
jgi:hypothetical protein